MTKKPFPVSLDSEIVDWIISKADGTIFRNRSHVVETALKEFQQNQIRDNIEFENLEIIEKQNISEITRKQKSFLNKQKEN